MPTPQVNRTLTALAGACCCVLAACHSGPVKQAAGAPAAETQLTRAALPATGKLLYGGDAHAWLTGAGDANDSGFCAAPLRSSLTMTPAWEFAYTAAEISPDTPHNLVQYDGTIVGESGTTVLYGLSAETGKLLFKQDVFKHDPSIASGENFNSLMFGPNGYLTGLDSRGRFYTWSVNEQGLKRIALSRSLNQGDRGYIATASQVICGGPAGLLRSYELADYSGPTWESQMTLPVNGVIGTRDGMALAWTPEGDIQCVDQAGLPRWSSTEAEQVKNVIIAQGGDQVYILTYEGDLICRGLADGREQWRVSSDTWATPPELLTRMDRVRQRFKGADHVFGQPFGERLIPHLFCATPDGPVLGLNNGLVMAFDHKGAIRWKVQTGPVLDGGLALQNALLLHVYWRAPALFFRDPDSLPWVLDAPDWPEITNLPALKTLMTELDASQNGGHPANSARQRIVYGRLVVLDMLTGAVRQTVVEPQPSAGFMLPAGDKLVMPELPTWRSDWTGGGLGRSRGRNTGEPCKIVAYSWLGQGS